MNEQFREFQKLIEKATFHLENVLCYSPRIIERYMLAWRAIRKYMLENERLFYSREVGEQFLIENIGIRRKGFTNKERFCFNGVKILTEFVETGKINVPKSPTKKPFVYPGSVGKIVVNFIAYSEFNQRRSYNTVRTYRRTLYFFSKFCDIKNIKSIESIDVTLILQYINQLDLESKNAIHLAISNLRVFMKYCYEQGLLSVDLSLKVPRYRQVRQPKLPSTYSKAEIEKLIKSIDRSTAMGKRNYAIVLLAARLGLRASDITRIKFSNIDWQSNQIQINQVKTGKELVLPLLVDVGNAIIDYLKFGRPESNEEYVFLLGRPPYGNLPNSNVVTHVVQRAFVAADIKINNRRFGPHSLRHSLSSRMLENSTILPVISEVLGHQSTESTRYYLRIDLKSMEHCMLDVPNLSTHFYKQEGGRFYE